MAVSLQQHLQCDATDVSGFVWNQITHTLDLGRSLTTLVMKIANCCFESNTDFVDVQPHLNENAKSSYQRFLVSMSVCKSVFLLKCGRVCV